MPVRNDADVVSFDADRVLEGIRDAVGEDLRACVEFDTEAYNPLYVDDATLALYGDEEAMHEQFEEVHSYVHLDFTEANLFTTLFPAVEEVRYIVTGMDAFTMLRVYVDREGLFVSVDPDASVDAVLDAVSEALAADPATPA
jgi:hypothetical protein